MTAGEQERAHVRNLSSKILLFAFNNLTFHRFRPRVSLFFAGAILGSFLVYIDKSFRGRSFPALSFFK
jgi:hypothetical protein